MPTFRLSIGGVYSQVASIVIAIGHQLLQSSVHGFAAFRVVLGKDDPRH